MVAACESLGKEFELIFVNDGSADDSLSLAIGLQETDKRMRIIDLSRNFGHHKALMTGLGHATGDLVFLIDSDLELDPKILLDFNKRLAESNCDVVYGIQSDRQGGWFERISGGMFFHLFNFLSMQPVPKNVVTARLMTQRYVRSLLQHRERVMMLAGLWAITGYEQIGVTVQKRHKGQTSYNLSRRFSVAIDAITSFSDKPLVFIFYLGTMIASVSFVAALYLAIRKIFFGIALDGWTSLMVSIWFLGGSIVFSIGVLGIYLSKVFLETKQRPYSIIRHVYEAKDEDHK